MQHYQLLICWHCVNSWLPNQSTCGMKVYILKMKHKNEVAESKLQKKISETLPYNVLHRRLFQKLDPQLGQIWSRCILRSLSCWGFGNTWDIVRYFGGISEDRAAWPVRESDSQKNSWSWLYSENNWVTLHIWRLRPFYPINYPMKIQQHSFIQKINSHSIWMHAYID